LAFSNQALPLWGAVDRLPGKRCPDLSCRGAFQTVASGFQAGAGCGFFIQLNSAENVAAAEPARLRSAAKQS
jgi:hypothetical protein